MLSKQKTLLILTSIVLFLSAAVSLGGIFLPGLYRDNEFVSAVWLGNDIVTLLLAIPVAIGAMILASRNSVAGKLLWGGSLWYMIYNYVFYMYGAAFNYFFLLYVLIFILSLWAFVLLAVDLSASPELKAAAASRKVPVRRISIYMLFFALFIGGMWVSLCLGFIFTGIVPEGITQTDHPTGMVFATDLAFLVTPLLIGAYYLWNRRMQGFVISSIIMVKCLLYPMVLLTGGIVAYVKTEKWDSMTPFYLVLGLGCFISLMFLLRGLKTEKN